MNSSVAKIFLLSLIINISFIQYKSFAKPTNIMYCYGVRHDRNNKTTPIYKPTLESNNMGYILKFNWQNQRVVFILTSSLIVTKAHAINLKLPGKVDEWTQFHNALLKVKKDGLFSIGAPVSERYVCEIEGKLRFIKDSKKKIFKLV